MHRNEETARNEVICYWYHSRSAQSAQATKCISCYTRQTVVALRPRRSPVALLCGLRLRAILKRIFFRTAAFGQHSRECNLSAHAGLTRDHWAHVK